jgi:hypothetical protein
MCHQQYPVLRWMAEAGLMAVRALAVYMSVVCCVEKSDGLQRMQWIQGCS